MSDAEGAGTNTNQTAGGAVPPPPPRQTGPERKSRWGLVLPLAGVIAALSLLAILAFWIAGDNTEDFQQLLSPILISALFLVLGFSAVGLIRYVFPEFSVKGDVLFVAILLTPIVAYLLLSGQVSSVSAPGVLEVNMATILNNPNAPVAQMSLVDMQNFAAATPIADCAAPPSEGDAPISTVVPYAEPLFPAMSQRGGIAQIVAAPQRALWEQQSVAPAAQNQQLAPPNLGQSAPVTPMPTEIPVAGRRVYLPLEAGRTYDADSLSTQVAELSRSDSFKFVVVVYGCKFFFADIPAAAASELFAERSADLVDAIARDPAALKDPARFPSVGYDTIRLGEPALSALNIMQARNIDALIVLDDQGNIDRVVTRADIERGLLLELAQRTSQ